MTRLKDFVANTPSEEWVRTLSKYYLSMDGITEEQVLSKAKTGKTPTETNEQLCEAYYYLGMAKLWKGDKEGAKQFFKKSVETDVKNFNEYDLSKNNLKLMEQGKL